MARACRTVIRRDRAEDAKGFTLMEMLVAAAVFITVVAITLSVLGNSSSIWRGTASKIEAFQGARHAFDLLTRNLSQATLSTYLDYDDPNHPTRYRRRSDLRFFSGQAGGNLPGTGDTGQAFFFQFPGNHTGQRAKFGGLETLLNTCGYFVAFSADPLRPWHLRPPHGSGDGKYRFRLMQLLVPTEDNGIFAASGAADTSWFAPDAEPADYGSTVLPVADNVIALVVEPFDPEPGSAPLAPEYAYNTAADGVRSDGTQLPTAHQLPPTVRVTMVAIDEASALRLENGTAAPAVITAALAGKFRRVENYRTDLEDLEGRLAEAGIQYRVFASVVPVRESRWTK